MKFRKIVLLTFYSLFFVVLIYRLFSLQIGKIGEKYVSLGKKEFTRHEFLYSKRGAILDRNMIPLAFSVPEGNRWKRVYPYGEIVSPVIGFVGRDGYGLEGVEFAFNKIIGGKNGDRILYRTGTGEYLPLPDYPHKEPINGKNIILTIDIDLQTYSYYILREKVKETGAKRGFVLILNPQTGEILAMVSFPSYNPYLFYRVPPSFYRNLCIQYVYEPGSVFKIIPFSTFIVKKGIKDNTHFVTAPGSLVISGHIIHDPPSSEEKKDIMTKEQVIIHSSNIGISRLALSLSRKDIFEMARNIGFGTKTGVLLPGEETGSLISYKKWTNLYTANFSFGQGVLVNGLQMALAYAAIANGGKLLAPQILKGISEGENIKEIHKKKVIRVVLNEDEAKYIKNVLLDVVEKGSGILAKIKGVKICGKTGTAQKVDPETGKYSEKRSIMSFIGFFPAEYPEFLIYILLDEPQKGRFASTVASPIFREIAERVYKIEKPYENLKNAFAQRYFGEIK